MQYIEYEYAKSTGKVYKTLADWVNQHKYLSTMVKGHTIKQWRKGRCLLMVQKERSQLRVYRDEETARQATKEQILPKFHKKQYTQKYLEGIWKL
jgi:hypothetical protein